MGFKMTKNDFEILDKKTLYQNFFCIKSYRVRHKRFREGWTSAFEREVFERNPVAAVIPYDPILDKVVLIEQFRIGALEDATSPWLLEIVAGIKEEDESVEEMIHRELQEESGLRADELLKIYEFWVSPGGSSEHMTLYCAKVDASQAGGFHGVLQDEEDILVHVFDSHEVFKKLEKAEIKNAAAIIGLQWLQLHKETLREKWR